MESASKIPDIYLRYFPLKEDYVYAQLSSQLTEKDYQSLTGITPGADDFKSSKGRAIILCLDKSGSMSGRPFEALQKGALMIGESLYSSNDYEKCAVVYYDDKVVSKEPKSLIDYNQTHTCKAGGSTNFVAVFKYIEQYTGLHPDLRDISVIFFTDGQDTCNNKSVITSSLQKLKQILSKKDITSRFLTIGFTSSHDALFLNEIAQAGSELGNFFYINTDQADYPEQI